MLLCVLIVLHHNLVPHFLQILLQHLDVSYFFIDIVPLDEHNIGQIVVQNTNQRVELVLIDLIVQPLADVAFPVSKGHLEDEYVVVLAH